MKAPENKVVIAEVLPVCIDSRGALTEPLGREQLLAQRHLHVAISEPGTVRGNHYHQRGTEILTIFGPTLVRIRCGENITDTEIPAEQVWRFTFPPGITHAIRNTGTRPTMLIAFNSEPYDPHAPDVVQDIILPY